MSTRTLEELQRFKSKNALPTWDLTMEALLAHATPATEPGHLANGRGANDGAERPS